MEVSIAEGTVTVTVDDDGDGVDEKVKRRSGLGNLDRRARARNGSFELTPRDGGGTRALWSARLDGPGGSEA